MKNYSKTICSCLVRGALVLAMQQPALAQDNDSANEADYSGGYLKIGIGYRHEVSPLVTEDKGVVIDISGRHQWQNGLFIEFPGRTSHLDPGLSYGYNFWNLNNWRFDLLAQKSQPDLRYIEVTDTTRLDIKRDGDMRAGIRATGFYDEATVQLNLSPYSNNDEYDDGIYASLWVAKEWQFKNWHFHGSIGLQYRSEEIMDYYYGIDASEATEGTPEYMAGAGTDITVQFGASYPITEDWVFETYVRRTNMSASLKDSPMTKNALLADPTRKENVEEFGFSINYIF